ncbi:MAG TPA: sensor histidine kinase [Chitinophagaceae bacterium]|nr:sensor histidine kinase [Chitinophagaceae bacterium]
MARRLIIIILMATLLAPCIAQESNDKTIPQLLSELKKNHTDAEKAKLLLDLALGYVHKPGEYTNDLETAISFCKEIEKMNQQLKDKKIEARLYFVYSNALREGKKNEAGKAYIEKSLTLYKTMSEPEEMGEALLELSYYYNIYNSNEDIEKKKECFEQALPLFKVAGNKEQQAGVLTTLADLDQILTNYVKAMMELHEALAIYQSIGYKKLQGVYDLLGVVSSDMGDYPDAVKYGLLALKTAEQVQDTSMQLCTIYNRLSVVYGNWSKKDEALVYVKKAMGTALKNNDRNAIKIVIMNLCSILSQLKLQEESLKYIRLTEAALTKPWNAMDSMNVSLSYIITYTEAKEYEKANNYVDQVIGLLKTHPGYNVPRNTYLRLTMYYLGVGQLAIADKYASDYLSHVISVRDKRMLGRAYLLKSQVDSARGNLTSALTNYKLYKSATDSILNEASSFQFAQTEVEHETEKKDNDIKLLRKQDELHQAQLAQTRLTKNVFIGGAILLLLLLGLIYNRYRSKQKTNKLLQAQQQTINQSNTELKLLNNEQQKLIKEKEWLIKEIHHRVKNNLQMVISLLNAQSEFLNNPSALEAIKESRERMQAIAIIHQKLYQVENSTQVNMRSYVNELVDNIKNSVSDTERIYFKVEVDDIDIDISQSVPLGLILNEAITNAVKYAYPGNEKGDISVSLKLTGTLQVQLKIVDHGKGLPAGMDTEHSNSLGLQLIKLFSEQLEGELYFINNNGLEIILNFKTAEYKNITVIKATA